MMMERAPVATPKVDDKLLNNVILTPIDTTNGIVKPLVSHKVPLNALLLNEQTRSSGADICSDKNEPHQVTIVMAVRQPACPSCMEQAFQIASLARTSGVSVLAVTKDSSNPMLLHFKRDYFADHPVYVDFEWNIYHALGNDKLSVWTIMKRALPLLRRKLSKKIKSPIFSKGDFWTRGGLLVFDHNGDLIHAEKEEFGLELDLQRIRKAIETGKAMPPL